MKKIRNTSRQITKQNLIVELQNQQKQFRSFVHSLNAKNKNKRPLNNSLAKKQELQNPQTQQHYYRFDKNIKQQKSKHKINAMNTSLTDSKQKLIKTIKNTQDFPPVNFMNCSEINQAHKEKYKIQNIKESLSILKQQKSKEKLNKVSKSNSKNQNQQSYSNRYEQGQLKKNSNFRLKNISNITWNPQSKQLLQQKANRHQIQVQSSFLMQILKMNVQTTLNFLKQQKIYNIDFKDISGKHICEMFQNIVKLHGFTIEDPLIKKYNNCIYYGQKPNFQLHHAGIILYYNGNAYFGSLRNFQKHGVGIQFLHSKNANDSFYNPEQCYQNGYIINRGNFYKNAKSGQFLIHAENYIYQGLLSKGYFEGYGVLITKTNIFKGIWSKNKKVSGIQNFLHQKFTYQGQYLNQKFNGKGKLKTIKQFYQGQFLDGLKHGKGIIVNEDFIYEGSFANDKKDGKGIFLDKTLLQKSQIESQSKSFNNNMFTVVFKEDYLIQKKQFSQKQFMTISQQSLSALDQVSSVKESLDNELTNNQPSKRLESQTKQKIPENNVSLWTKRIERNEKNRVSLPLQSKIEGSRMKQDQIRFNYIPCEPEQEYIYGKQLNKISHLDGNSKYRSNRKWNRNY